MLTIQEEERRQLARELHDEIGQVLTAVRINLQSAQVSACSDRLQDRLRDCIDITSQAIDTVRGRSLELRPALLDDLGLVAAMEQFIGRQAERSVCAIRLSAQPLVERPPPQIEIACYRIMEEAVTNALRHSGARRIQVGLSVRRGRLELRVRDDGRGFDVPSLRSAALGGGSFGLLGMEERALLAGGGIELSSQPGQGCEVRAWLPLSEEAR